MLILRCKESFTYDRLGRCFRFVYIYARNKLPRFRVATGFSANKDLYMY